MISRGGVDYSRKAISEIKEKSKGLGIKPCGADVILGTMFMARTKCLMPLARRWTLEDFDLLTPETAHKVFRLAHWLEGVFAFLVTSQGYLVSDGKWPYSLAWMGAKLMFVVGRSWRLIKSFGRL